MPTAVIEIELLEYIDRIPTEDLVDELRDRGGGLDNFTDDIAKAFEALKRGDLTTAKHHLAVLHREFCEPHA